MSYFDMISFDESPLLEGKQAEEYKARKAAEKKAERSKEVDQINRRYPTAANAWEYHYGNSARKNPKQRQDMKKGLSGDDEAFDRAMDRMADDEQRQDKAAYIANKDYYSGKRKLNTIENSRAIDTTNRHIRRHPKTYKEAAELLEAYNPEYIELS